MKNDFLQYLNNLSVVTITFVGFAALYLAFKQQTAGKMTNFDVMLTKNHFMLSFMVVVPLCFRHFWLLFPQTNFLGRWLCAWLA